MAKNIFGPNAGYYYKALINAMNKDDLAKAERIKSVGRAYNTVKMGTEAHQAYQAAQAAAAAKNANDAYHTGLVLQQYGISNSLPTAAGASAGSGIAGGASAGGGLAGGGVAGIAAGYGGASTVGAAGAAGVAGAAGTAGAAGASSIAGSAGASGAGSAAAGASGLSIAMPIVGLGLAIGSSRPGDALFPAKKFMYNTSVGPMMDKADPWWRKNISGPITPFGQNTVAGRFLGPFGPLSYVHEGMNWVFGNPNEQEEELKNRKSRLLGLRAAFNMKKATDLYNGEEQPDE